MINFIKDNAPQDNMVVFKEHDPYIEAIVAAIYYDSGSYDTTKRWILKFLIPMLQGYI